MGVQLHAIRTTWVFSNMQSELHGCSVTCNQNYMGVKWHVIRTTWVFSYMQSELYGCSVTCNQNYMGVRLHAIRTTWVFSGIQTRQCSKAYMDLFSSSSMMKTLDKNN